MTTELIAGLVSGTLLTAAFQFVFKLFTIKSSIQTSKFRAAKEPYSFYIEEMQRVATLIQENNSKLIGLSDALTDAKQMIHVLMAEKEQLLKELETLKSTNAKR